MAMGAVALQSLFGKQGRGGELPRTGAASHPSGPHRLPRAKRVIFLCMAGGPSHLETFDFKPQLDRLAGEEMPGSFTQGMPIAQLQGKPLVVGGHMANFSRQGESGQWVSDFLPHISQVIDEVAIVRSMVTEQINHDPAHTFMNTGTQISGRPSMGAWITYGLGAEAKDLPGFVVMTSVGGRNPQPIAARQWSSGCLPSKYQGVEFYATGDPVHYVSNPPGVDRQRQRDVIDSVAELNRLRYANCPDEEIVSRIAQYELAFQMQMSVPELMDMSDEPQHVLDMYGVDQPGDGSFASNCLLARRLAERGVRFIQLYHRGWDHHGGLKKYMGICSSLTDRPTAALIRDLRQRGMLDDTLIVWGGEFGRTPMSQGDGRDHHIQGFSMMLCGGGIRGGVAYGETDELGYHAVQDVVHVRDLHATMLHLLGMDHRRLSVPHQGLDVKLTGVKPARVVRDILV
jgi:hypothetical protein